MAERAGYDQPGDGYTDKHATIGGNAPPPYQPGISPPQQSFGQQTYPMMQAIGQSSNATVVVNQPQTGAVIIQQRPPDYLIPSILACFCCFWPTGICAIYYANEAKNLMIAGDYAAAMDMSNRAKRLIITSVVVGIILVVIVVVLRVLAYQSNETSYTDKYNY